MQHLGVYPCTLCRDICVALLYYISLKTPSEIELILLTFINFINNYSSNYSNNYSSNHSNLMILIIVAIIARPYSSYYSSHHFARLSLFLLLSLRSAIPIFITPLDHRHFHYYHSAWPFPLLSLRSAIAIIITIVIIITSLSHG